MDKILGVKRPQQVVSITDGLILSVGPFREAAGLTQRHPGLTEKEDGWLAGAVVVENDKGEVLLLKRGMTAPWMPGKWNLPGGNVDPGESVETTARREAEEEASIRVGPMRKLLTVSMPGGKATFFHATRFSGKVKIDWESSEFRWVPKEEAPGYDLVPGIRQALEKVAGG